MKNKILLTTLVLVFFSFNLFGQTERYWTGASDININNENNWTGSGSILASDILIFQATGLKTLTLEANLACSGLKLQGGSEISITTASGYEIYINDDGTTANDFFIESLSDSLQIDFPVNFSPNAKALINGRMATMIFGQLISEDPNSIVFSANSRFTSYSTINPFGNSATNQNTVVFENFSNYYNQNEISPFALTPPASAVTFSEESNFHINSWDQYTDFQGRTYGNIIITQFGYVNANQQSQDFGAGNNNLTINTFTADYFSIIDISSVSSYKDSKIIFTGDGVFVNNSSDVLIKAGNGGIEITSSNFVINGGDGTGNLELAKTNFGTSTSCDFISSGSYVTVARDFVLGSNPIGSRFKIYGTIDFGENALLQPTSYNGYIQMMDNSKFITANPGGITASANNLENSYSVGQDPYYTPLTTFELNGSVAQNLGNSYMNDTFGHIIINNPNGVYLDYTLNIYNKITMQTGNFYMNDQTIVFYYQGTYEEIGGQFIGSPASDMYITNYGNVGTTYPFTLPSNFEIGYLEINNGNNVYITDDLGIYGGLNLKKGYLDISGTTALTKNCRLYSIITYDANGWYNIVGNQYSYLYVENEGDMNLKSLTVGELELGVNGNVTLQQYETSPLKIFNNFKINQGTFNIGNSTLILGGDFLKDPIATFTSTNESILQLTNESGTDYDFTIELSDLKSLIVNRNSTINITGDLIVHDQFNITNATINVDDNSDWNSSLTLNGNILQTNSEITSVNGYSYIKIGGNFTNDCTVYFDPNAQFLNGFILDRTGGGNIHLGSDMNYSFVEINNGKLYLGDNNLIGEAYSNFSTTNALGFDNTRYIVIDGSGSVIMRNGIAKGTHSFLFDVPIGTISGYTPIKLSTSVADYIYYDVSFSVSDVLPNVTNTDNWVQKTWTISSTPALEFDATFYWKTSNQGALFDDANCFVSEFDGSAWSSQTVGESATLDASGFYSLTKIAVNTSGTFAVKTPKASECPTSVSSDVVEFCAGDISEITLSYSNDAFVDAGDNLGWFDESGAISYGTNMNQIITAPTETTIYKLILSTGASTTECGQVPVTVNQYSIQPDMAEVFPTDICAGETGLINFSQMGGIPAPDATTIWYSDAELTQIVNTNETFETAYPTETTTYYLVYEGVCNTTSPMSTTVTLHQYATEPSVTDIDICENDIIPIELSYSGGYIPSDATVNWLDESGAVSYGTGNNIPIETPEFSTTYYLSINNFCSDLSIPLNINVNSAPIADLLCTSDNNLDNNLCFGTDAEFEAWGTENFEFLIDNISQQANSTNNIFTIPSTELTDNFIVSVVATDANNCKDTASLEMFTYEPSIAPQGIDFVFCDENITEVLLSYENGYLAPEAVANWYSDETLGNYIASGNDLFVPYDETISTYYVVFEGGCNTTDPIPVNIEIGTPPEITLECSDNDLIACEGENLSFFSSGGEYYEFIIDGISQQNSDISTFEYSDYTDNFSISVVVTDALGCTAEESLFISVSQAAVAPTTAGELTICDDGTLSEITLSYSGGILPDGVSDNWYSNAELTDFVGTGNDIITTYNPDIPTYYIYFEGACNQIDAIPLDVYVNPYPVASLDYSDDDLTICSGEDILFTGTGGENYRFYVGENLVQSGTDIFYNATNISEDFTLSMAIDDGYFCSDSIFVDVFVHPSPIAEIMFDGNTNVCQGDELTFNGNGENNNYFYVNQLNEPDFIGENFIFSDYNSDFTVFLVVEDLNLCTDTTSLDLFVFEPSIAPDAIENLYFCEQAPSEITLTYGGGFPSPEASINWYSVSGTTEQFVGNGNNLNVFYDENIDFYYVQFEGLCNITDPLNLDIIINPNPTAILECSDEDYNVCIGDNLIFNASGGDIYEFYFNDNLIQSDTENLFHFDEFTDDFTINLKVIDANNCESQTSLNFNVEESPILNIPEYMTIHIGEEIELNQNGNPDYSYFWKPDKWINDQFAYNPLVNPLDTITYTVEVENYAGCKSFYQIKFDVDFKIFVFDAISPNNDGKNDYWVIRNIERFEGNKVQIFDRNGFLIYEKENYQNDFDGTNSKTGELLPYGTYYYIIDLNDGTSPFKGTFMIFR